MDKLVIEINEAEHIQTKKIQFIWAMTMTHGEKTTCVCGVAETWNRAKADALAEYAERIGVVVRDY